LTRPLSPGAALSAAMRRCERLDATEAAAEAAVMVRRAERRETRFLMTDF
jgi:hypothetical protein